MIKILFIMLSAALTNCDINKQDLTLEIQNTQQLISLYRQKLELLQDIYNNHFPNIPLQSLAPQISTLAPKKKNRVSQYLVELKQFQSAVHLLPKNHLLYNNKILSIFDYHEVSQFFGEVIHIEEGKITTNVGGKLGMTIIATHDGAIKKEEFLMGKTAVEMNSLWHRNFNIKDGEDILIQWSHNKIYFRGHETKELQLNAEESIVAIFSLNQYKIIYVSTHRVGTINSRSLQMGDFIQVNNITRKHQNKEALLIVAAFQIENGILLLLNTGELAKYFSDRIIMVQNLPKLEEQFTLSPFEATIQVVGGYLFVIDKQNFLIKVFAVEGGRFAFKMGFTLPKIISGSKVYELYKLQDSIRLLVSSPNQSHIYELLMPIAEEYSYTPSYLKVIGVVAVIGCFIYFKVTRKESEKDDMRQMVEKRREGERASPYRYPPEVEELAKKKRLEGGGKMKDT